MKTNLDFISSPEKRQSLMTIVVAVAVLLTFLVLYFYYFADKPVASPQPKGPTILRYKIDFGILESQTFKDLKQIGDYPIEIQESDVGRDNPYSPF